MDKFILRYLLILLLITTFSNALEDASGELNLQRPKKLNIIEGNTGTLTAIKQDEMLNSFPSSNKKLKDFLSKNAIDISKYKKVKLIDAVLETLSHSDLLKSSREKVIQYEIKVQNAMADYYPTIDFEYTYGKTRSTPSGDVGSRFKFFKDKNYKFILRQNLYSGGATNYNLKSVAKKLEVAKNQYTITLEGEIKKSIKAYFGVVFANRSVIVSERNMKKLNKVLEIVTIKYDNGAASIGDFTSIKANVANSMTKLVKVKSKFIESLRYYEYIVGIDFENTLPFEKSFDVSIGDFDKLFKRALEKNRELVNYYKTIEAEKYSQKTAESSFEPNVDFELSYKKVMDGEDLDEEESYLNGKVKLTYNIFNGGRDKNKVLEKSSAIRDLKYRLSEEKRKLKWNLSKIHTSVESVSQALKSTITEVKASRKMVSAYWDAFKLGEQDLQLLLTGQRQLNTAETELVKYEENNATMFFNILEITGDLSSFFDIDPENPKFIDFSKTDYKKSIIAKDNSKISLDSKKDDKDLKSKEDILKEEVKEVVAEIPLPKPSLDENINSFLKEFLNFENESYMIEISNFDNIYEAFDFIKSNNFDTNSFSYDVIEKYNIKTRVAHNNFRTKIEAEDYIKALELKELDKKYKIKKVKNIKSSYSKYIDGLKVKVKKTKTKIKIVEKIRQLVEKKDFLTNEEFKKEFLNAKDNYFTINVSSFTKNEKVEEFIKSNDIYEQSFFFKYGDNRQLIKLVYGIYDNYLSLEKDLNKFILENNTIFPIVEKIGLVKNLYNQNIDINIKKEEPLEYEYINISKKDIKKVPVNKTKEKEEILTLTKRPSLDDINKKKKEKLKEVKKELEELLSTKQDNKQVEPKKNVEPKIEEKTEKVVPKSLLIESAFEKKFLEAPKKYYTLNLASLETMDIARSFVKRNNIEENTLLVISNSGKIMVMSGVYPLRDEALNAISDLPNNIKRNNPYIQKIFRTQESYLKNNLNRANEVLVTEEQNEEQELAEVKRLEEEKIRLERIKADKLAEDIRIKEEARLLKEQKRLEELKKEEDLKAKKLAKEKKLAEAKRLEEEKIRLEGIKAEKLAEAKKLELEQKAKLAEQKILEDLKAKKILEEKRLKELKLKKLAEAKRLEEEKIKLEKIKAEKLAEDIRIKEEARLLKEQKRLEELKKEEDLKAKKLAKEKKLAEAKRLEEEKIRLEGIKAEKLAEDTRIKEEARLLKEQELKAKRLKELKKLEDLKVKKLAAEEKQIKEEAKKARLKKEAELKAKKLAEETRIKRIKANKLAKEKKLAEEKARLKRIKVEKLAEAKKLELEQKAKLTEQKILEDLKAKKILEEKRLKELKLKKLAEAKRLEEEKIRLERIKAEKLAEDTRIKEEARLLKEQKRLEWLKKAEDLKAKKLAKEKKLAEEKARLKKLKLKKLAEAKRLEEEKIRLEGIKAEKLAEDIRIKEEARLLKEQELKAKRLKELKKLEDLKVKKLAAEEKQIKEEKIKVEKLAEAKKLEEEQKQIKEEAKKVRLKKEAELKAKKLAEETRLKRIKADKLTEEKRLDEELKAKKLAEDDNKNINLFNNLKQKKENIIPKSNNNILTNRAIVEVDFANDSKQLKKERVIPYSERLKDFKKLFYKSIKAKYTLKLTTINSDKVKWYVHRFALEPNYIAIKRGSKSDIYYGVFNSVSEANKKTETLHPKIYESKPSVKKIGSIL